MRVSPDSLLRLLKRDKLEVLEVLSALGVDDFTFRRGINYGTLIIDLKTHRPIDLLPDRSGTSLKAWLLAHPGVKIISRDRSTEYTRGATGYKAKSRRISRAVATVRLSTLVVLLRVRLRRSR